MSFDAGSEEGLLFVTGCFNIRVTRRRSHYSLPWSIIIIIIIIFIIIIIIIINGMHDFTAWCKYKKVQENKPKPQVSIFRFSWTPFCYVNQLGVSISSGWEVILDSSKLPYFGFIRLYGKHKANIFYFLNPTKIM